jgi:hypothetical protein
MERLRINVDSVAVLDQTAVARVTAVSVRHVFTAAGRQNLD